MNFEVEGRVYLKKNKKSFRIDGKILGKKLIYKIWDIIVISVESKDPLCTVVLMQQVCVYPVIVMSILQMHFQDVTQGHLYVKDVILSQHLLDVWRKGCLFAKIVIGWDILVQIQVLHTKDNRLTVILAALQLLNSLKVGRFS